MTTTYGVELTFPLPAGADPVTFGDAFDNATEHFGVTQGFYSIDAALADAEMFILVGVIVPEGAEPQDQISVVLNGALFPALETIGVDPATVSTVKKEVAAFV